MKREKIEMDFPQAKEYYIFEEDRINSFKFWPHDDNSACNIKKMSEAGFYWKGNEREDDTAACFACDKVLDGWEEDDNPWLEHQKHAPQCPFIKINKSEKDITIDEFLKLFQIIITNKILKKCNETKSKHENEIEKRREIVIKHFK